MAIRGLGVTRLCQRITVLKETNTTVFNTGEGGLGRKDLAPVCKLSGTPKPGPTPSPPSDYQKLGFGKVACPKGLEIESESECRQAIEALGITGGGNPWIGSRTTMPKGCTLQKATDTMVFNTGEGGSGRKDLAPVCKVSL